MVNTTTIIEIVNGQIVRVDTNTQGKLSSGQPISFSLHNDFTEKAKTPQEKTALIKAISDVVNAPEYRSAQEKNRLAHQRTIEAVQGVLAPALLSGTCELRHQ